MRAQSRLRPALKSQLLETNAAANPRNTEKTWAYSRAKNYLRHLPLLILSAGWYAAAAWILLSVHPADIQNSPFPNAYGPLQLVLLFGNFFFFSFLFLHTRRGFLASFGCAVLLFLKLQQVELNIILISSLVLTLLCTELALQWVTKQQSP